MARHLLPATKERMGFGEGVQSPRSGVSKNWDPAMPVRADHKLRNG